MTSTLSHGSRLVATTLGTLFLGSLASAQVQPVAFESFENIGGPGAGIGGLGSGSGWQNFWYSGMNQDDAVVSQPGFDALGDKAIVNNEFTGSYRIVDIMPHPELDDGGLFGADNSTMWFTFTLQDTSPGGPVVGDTYFAGFSLFIQLQGEQLFMGSPWMAETWGIDDTNGTPGSVTLIAGSNDDVRATIVVRVDWLPGAERVRMWIDPPVPHPTSPPPLDVMVPDFRWNEVRFDSGGQNMPAKWSFDAIRIEKGIPTAGPIGTNYCGPAIPNSTGASGTISANGLTAVASNDVTLMAAGLPAGQFGYFLAGQTMGFFNPPGSSGIICLSGNIGRYNQVANIIQGPSGSVAINLNAIPVNPPRAVNPGETWLFQCWYRDVSPFNSNFTDGLMITFN